MCQIELRRRAQRALDRPPKTDFQAVVEAVKELAQTPRPRGVEKVKTTGLWRIRQGDYRIIYAIDDNQQLVTVVRIGQRHYKEIRKHKATHRLFKPATEWLEIQNATPPVISEELFNQA